MGFCYMGSGAGAAALNFRVTAYSTEDKLADATPRDNTIGIVTDTKITEWIISKKEPENPTVGMLWIETGESSLGQIDALKKNSIIICPIAAHQYTAEGWVDKIAKTFLTGVWTAWEPEAVFLFRAGDQNTAVTGGWSGIDTAADTISLWYNAESEDWATESCSTVKAIDLTGYRTLSVIVDEYEEYFTVYLKDSSGNKVAEKSASAFGELTVNLSNVSGSYYIVLECTSADHGGYVDTKFTVSEVKLLL